MIQKSEFVTDAYNKQQNVGLHWKQKYVEIDCAPSWRNGTKWTTLHSKFLNFIAAKFWTNSKKCLVQINQIIKKGNVIMRTRTPVYAQCRHPCCCWRSSTGRCYTVDSFCEMVKLQQVEDSWPEAADVPVHTGSAECITKGSRRIGVLIKIETNVSGSSRKGRDSLSPQLVEYLTGGVLVK